MSLADEIAAYAAYRNGYETAKHALDDDELALFEEDMAKAKQAMFIAWDELRYQKVFGGWVAGKPADPDGGGAPRRELTRPADD